MDYLFGSGLLLAAVLVLAVGRIVLARRAVAPNGEAFGLNEAFAVSFTVLLAFSAAVFARRAVADWSLASLTLTLSALAATAVAATAALILIGRLTGGPVKAGKDEVPVGPQAPQTGRRGWPGERQGGRAPGIKRAA